MQQMIRIEAIETRAARFNLNLCQLMRRVPEVIPSTVYRWKKGKPAKAETLDRYAKLLNDELDAVEERIKKSIAPTVHRTNSEASLDSG
jgi:hypothetical protein